MSSNEVKGLNKNKDKTEIDIKPHIIIFDNTSIKKVIPKFAEKIKEFQNEGKIPNPAQHKFMAIAWRKEHEDLNKLGLSDYWNDHLVYSYKNYIDFKVLKDYLLFLYNGERKLEPIQRNILNAFLKIIRLENIIDENNHIYTKRKLRIFLKEHFVNEYEIFKLFIYKWSIDIIKGNIDEVFESVKKYIPKFLSFFGKEINNSNEFINGKSEIIIENIEIIESSNIYKSDNIEIEIGTVHSAKGQTHTATLYLETFFYGKYESEYLKDAILGNNSNHNGAHQKQASKMVYVGFSRPTHLLCIAIHKERFTRELSEINRKIWEIIEV